MTIDKTKQLLEEMQIHGTFGIVVSWVPIAADGAIGKGDQVRVQGTASLTNEETANKLLAVAIQLNKHLGLLPANFLDDYVPKS